jgi:hypothetical protein
MTTTIERIAAILDEDTATSRATIADMGRRLEEMDAAIQSMTERAEFAEERCRAVERIDRARTATVAQQLVEPSQEVADLAAQLRDVIDDSKRATARQMTLIERLRERLREQKDKLVAEQETIIDERNKQIEDLQVRLELKAAAAESRDETYRGLIHERDRIIDSNAARIGGMIKELRRRDATITDLNRLLDESHAENARLVLQVAEVEAREEKNIVDMQATIKAMSDRAALFGEETTAHVGRLKNYVEKVDRAMGGIGCRSPEAVVAAAATLRTLVIEHQQNCWQQTTGVEETKPSTGTPFDEKLPSPFVKTECLFPSCGPACRRPGPDQTAPVVAATFGPQTTPATNPFAATADVVKEQGPWIVFEGTRARADVGFMGWNGWRPSLAEVAPFDLKSDAVVALEGWRMGGYSNDSACVMTVDEARAIEAKKTTGV